MISYAAKYLGHVNRVVQIGPSPPHHGKQYPAHLTNEDAIRRWKGLGARVAEREPDNTGARR